MKKAGYRRHVFVCLNERQADHPKGCCKHRGADAIFAALKMGAVKAGVSEDVRVNRAGCFEHCELPPSVVIYPEAVWYRVPTVEDAEEILREHVVGGKIVERLLMDNAQFFVNRAGCFEHCELAPSVVIYPEAVWYRVPTVEDAEEILREHVVGGKVVERLLMDNASFFVFAIARDAK